MIERIKNGKFILGAMLLFVMAIIIPVTINQVQKNQESRSRASGEAVAVILDPLTKNVNVGDTLDVAVNINGGQNNVTAVDITFTYDNALLDNPSFVPTQTFTSITNSVVPGTMHFVGVNPTAASISGSLINIGILHFEAKAAGTATVGFSNIHINASGVAAALPVDTTNTQPGNYTITATSNASPTPFPTDGTNGHTQVEINFQLIGVGSNNALGLNNNPRRPQRNIQVGFFNGQNQSVGSVTGTATYDNATGLYKANVDTGLATGSYIVKVRADNTLFKQIPGIQNITAGTSNTTPTTTLVSGDLNGDNEINLIDYNLLLACLGHSTICTGN